MGLAEKIKEIQPLSWNDQNQSVFIIDQRRLPYEYKEIEITNHFEMADAIKNMTLRGAPLIGIAAAFGMVLAAKNNLELDYENFIESLRDADKLLRSTRPTGVNLTWALDKIQSMLQVQLNNVADPNSRDTWIPDRVGDGNRQMFNAILEKAKWILEDDINRCKKIAHVGAEHIKGQFKNKLCKGDKQDSNKLRIMTHCNAGALATGGYGTALGVIRKLHEENLIEMVYANETRPRQQGARLTVWELVHDNIPVTLNTDNMAAYLMQRGLIDCVVVGADRVATNGDAANKIGTYQLAIVAKYHNIPFYVAMPNSSLDESISCGDQIPIEERGVEEVTYINGKACTSDKANIINPSFDVTPKGLISAIFTE